MRTTPRQGLPVCLLLFCWVSVSFAGQQADQAAIRRYSQQAEQALAAKNMALARTALEKLSHLTPNSPEVYANLGMVYYHEGRFEQSAETFKHALALNPKIPNVQLMLGICYAILGRAEKAIPILEPAFQHPPNKQIGRTVGIELMNSYSSLGQRFKALDTCDELLERYPNDPELLYRASHLYGDMALNTMQRLTQVAPNSPWKRMAFAEALESKGRYPLAIIEYRKVIAADPDIPGVHYRLGRALLLDPKGGENNQAEALKEFQQALAQNPRDASAEFEVGQIYFRQGNTQQAVTHFSRAVSIDPRVAGAQVSLARALIQVHKRPEAMAHLHKAIELDPKDPVAHFLLAEAYKALGNKAEYQNEMALYQKYRPCLPETPCDRSASTASSSQPR